MEQVLLDVVNDLTGFPGQAEAPVGELILGRLCRVYRAGGVFLVVVHLAFREVQVVAVALPLGVLVDVEVLRHPCGDFVPGTWGIFHVLEVQFTFHTEAITAVMIGTEV